MKDWRNQWRTIQQKCLVQDKEVENFIQTSKHIIIQKLDLRSLQTQQEKQNFDRESEKHSLFDQLSLNKKTLDNLQDLLINGDRSFNQLQKIQSLSQTLGTQLEQLKIKEGNIFNRFYEEFQDLEEELDDFTQKLEFYENGNIPMHKWAQDSKENQDLQNNPLQENSSKVLEIDEIKRKIQEIDSQIAHLGGLDLGWPQEDQQQFLKIVTSFDNKVTSAAFANKCLQVLGVYTESQIAEHIKKFQTFNVLKEQKKNLLEKYKAEKKNLKEQQAEVLEKDVSVMEVPKQQKKLQEKQKQEELEKKKKEVLLWKLQKEAEKEQKEAEQRREAQLQQQRKKELLSQKQEELDQKIREHNEQKQIEKLRELERQQRLNQQPKAVSQASKRRIEEKEQQLLEKQIALKQKKTLSSQKKKEQEEYLKEQTKHKFSYVESKLSSTTVAIESKQTKKYNPETASTREATTLAGNVLRTTGRAIPLWRQGV